MNSRSIVLPVLILALAAAAAHAGGRARIVSVEAPRQVAAGAAFDVAFTVRPEVGRRNIEPTVIAQCGDQTVTVAAASVGSRNRYRATLKLPRAGSWTVKVNSSYCQTVMDPVAIRATAAKGAVAS